MKTLIDRIPMGPISFFALIVLVIPLAIAAGMHGGGHGDKASDDHDGESMAHMDGSDGGGHAHETWVTPPEAYLGMESPAWGDHRAIDNGRRLYQQNCQACHGTDGKGGGIVASSLEHAPADLTSHLHSRERNNDGYLLWRVSQGGTVEPFRSQNSTMPAFEQSLTLEERWDVLAYIHDVFHRGFIEERTG